MKSILVLGLFFICLTKARPQQNVGSSKDAVILKYESQNDVNGLYHFAYETSDGQSREEQGILQNPGTENEAISVSGSFSFLGQDGILYTVKYTADENGFRPEGDHLPTNRQNPAVVQQDFVLSGFSANRLGISDDVLASLVG